VETLTGRFPTGNHKLLKEMTLVLHGL